MAQHLPQPRMRLTEDTYGGPQRTQMLSLEHDSARHAITLLSSANDVNVVAAWLSAAWIACTACPNTSALCWLCTSLQMLYPTADEKW